MTVIYRRIGFLDYYNQQNEKIKYSPDSTLSPQSKNKFREITPESLNIFEEEATPEYLGIVFPYPEYFVDTKGYHWKRFDHSFNNEFLQTKNRGRLAYYNTDKGNTFIPPQKDKDANVSRPGTVPEGYIMGSTLRAMRVRGAIK